MLKGLKRIVFQVADVEKAKQWYQTLLSSDPVFDSPVVAIFRIGPNTLSLTRAASTSPDESGKMTVYWEVEDVDKTFARLLDLGATPKIAPGNVLTARTALVVDPFGNVLGLTGNIPHDEQRTVENQASETAYSVGVCRALGSYDARAEIRRPDPYSELFLNEETRLALQDEAKRQALIDRRISRPLYGFFLARSGFVDDAFRRALRARVPQIVFLGAGYDTRALRFRAELGGTRVFEVDAPSTQARKTALLQASHTPVPEQVSFVSVNFKTEDFAERLQNAGFQPSAATLFVWEGVTYYLSLADVDRTLELAWRHAAPGSSIVFDYMTKQLQSINAGEPFLSWMAPEVMPGYLEQRGFRVVEHLDAAAMARGYLTLADGTAAEKPLSTIRLVYAERLDSRSIVE